MYVCIVLLVSISVTIHTVYIYVIVIPHIGTFICTGWYQWRFSTRSSKKAPNNTVAIVVRSVNLILRGSLF